MSTYRFVTSNILTGQILSDTLPIVGQTATKQINQVGSFSGYLPLTVSGNSAPMVANWINAVQPWKSVLWILQDGFPIWNGPITGWPHESAQDGTLPLQAASVEEMFKHRQVATALTYTNMDIFDIFKAEMTYALSKTPNGQIAGTGSYAGKSGIVDTVLHSGVVGSITEAAGFQSIYDCFNDLVTSYALEYTFSPSFSDALSLFTQVQIGLPQLGRLFSSTGLRLELPALGQADYAWQWIPTSPVNRIVVSGSGSGTNPKTFTATATAQNDLNAGFPLLEGNTSFNGTVASQAQLNNYAQNTLYATSVLKSLTPMFMSGGDAWPRIRDTQLGDEVMLIVTSPLHPSISGGPGLTQLARITGWTLTFPNAGTAEETQWQLGQTLVGGV